MTIYVQEALFAGPRPFEGMTDRQLQQYNEKHVGDLVRYSLGVPFQQDPRDENFQTGTFLGIWTEADSRSLRGQIARFSLPPQTYEIRNERWGTFVGPIRDITAFEVLVTNRYTCSFCDAWTPLAELIERDDGWLTHPYDCTAEVPVATEAA